MVDNGTSWNGFTVVVSAHETAGKAPGTFRKAGLCTYHQATLLACWLLLLVHCASQKKQARILYIDHPLQKSTFSNPERRASRTKHPPLLRNCTSACSITTPRNRDTNQPTFTMAPKRNAAAPPPSSIPPSVATPAHGQTTASSQPIKSTKASAKSTPRNSQNAQDVLLGVWNRYVEQTPQRVKLIDVFLAFLIVVGVLQFVYCVIAGNYVCFFNFHQKESGADFYPHSHSTLSCPVSRLLSVNSSSLLA